MRTYRVWGGKSEFEEEHKAGRQCETSLADLAENLNKLKAVGFKQVFMNTMPAVGEVIRQMIDLADPIPCRPPPDDLDAVGATVDLVEEAGKQLIFVVNGATKRARLTGQAVAVLTQHGTVALAPVHHSVAVAFPSSAITGELVTEVDPDIAPSREIAEL